MSFFSRKKVPRIAIHSSSAGIELGTASAPGFVPWSSIIRIVAFKRDVFTQDLLCLALETDQQTVLEVNESMEGWDTLVRELEEHLVGAVPFDTWFMAAISPPFEVSITEVYRRT